LNHEVCPKLAGNVHGLAVAGLFKFRQPERQADSSTKVK